MSQMLRKYHLQEGKAEEWVKFWSEQLVPLRQKHGFEVIGGWVTEDEKNFYWIISHDGDFDKAEGEYHADRNGNVEIDRIPTMLVKGTSEHIRVNRVL